MRKTRYITFCALMSALSVVFLLLGSLLDVLDITAVVLTSVIILIAREEIGVKSLAIYGVTALISIFLLPNKLIAVEYLLISIYPVIKPFIDKRSVAIKWLLKIVYILSAALGVVLTMKVFTPDSPLHWDIIFGIGMVVIFFLYDILLHRFSIYYRLKLRHQLRLDKFFKQK